MKERPDAKGGLRIPPEEARRIKTTCKNLLEAQSADKPSVSRNDKQAPRTAARPSKPRLVPKDE